MVHFLFLLLYTFQPFLTKIFLTRDGKSHHLRRICLHAEANHSHTKTWQIYTTRRFLFIHVHEVFRPVKCHRHSRAWCSRQWQRRRQYTSFLNRDTGTHSWDVLCYVHTSGCCTGAVNTMTSKLQQPLSLQTRWRCHSPPAAETAFTYGVVLWGNTRFVFCGWVFLKNCGTFGLVFSVCFVELGNQEKWWCFWKHLRKVAGMHTLERPPPHSKDSPLTFRFCLYLEFLSTLADIPGWSRRFRPGRTGQERGVCSWWTGTRSKSLCASQTQRTSPQNSWRSLQCLLRLKLDLCMFSWTRHTPFFPEKTPMISTEMPLFDSNKHSSNSHLKLHVPPKTSTSQRVRGVCARSWMMRTLPSWALLHVKVRTCPLPAGLGKNAQTG